MRMVARLSQGEYGSPSSGCTWQSYQYQRDVGPLVRAAPNSTAVEPATGSYHDGGASTVPVSICYVWQGNRLGGPGPGFLSASGSASFFVVRCQWQVGLPPIGGALLASAGEFAVYQPEHNQPLPVVMMSLVVV